MLGLQGFPVRGDETEVLRFWGSEVLRLPRSRGGSLVKDFVFERKTPNGWEHVNPKKFAFKVCGTARHAERLLREMVEGDTVNVLGSAYRMTPR